MFRIKGDVSCTTNSIDILSKELFNEVRQAAPSAQLSYTLRCQLEKCDKLTRAEICARTRQGCAPLFIACKRGNVEIVEYLITVCGANVEQRGLYEVVDDQSVHNVTPLWCAAVACKVRVVEVLIHHGADVNSVSNTGSTPVRSACFMTNLVIVKILVGAGADIQRPNYNGGTCLINSVQSVELCEFLLQNDANVNAQDIQNKTALHYSIQEHRLETTKLLLQYGADPSLKSRYGDDALQTACLKGACDIFDHLIENFEYTPAAIASSYELLGSTFLEEHHDSQKALHFWGKALEIRESHGIDKVVYPPRPQYSFVTEMTTREELQQLTLDLDAMRMQSLLISERILGTFHKDLIYRLMYRGAAYADSYQYQQCVNLWKYALELRIQKDSILFCDTCFTAEALVKLFLDLHHKSQLGVINSVIRMEDISATIELLVKDMVQCAQLITIAPQYRRQLESYDKVMQILVNLLYLFTQVPESQVPKTPFKKRLHHIITNIDPRGTSGDSLLHLCVSRNITLRSHNLFGQNYGCRQFSNVEVASLLLECGAKPNALNFSGSTPLHVAAASHNFKEEICLLLLNYGAHIDIRNKFGQTPSRILLKNRECRINPLRYQSLRCLAASFIAENRLPFKGFVPVELEEFIEAH